MSPPQSFSSLNTYDDTDSDTTPRASPRDRLLDHDSDISPLTNPLIMTNRTLPFRNTTRVDREYSRYYDEELGGRQLGWPDAQTVLRHILSDADGESGRLRWRGSTYRGQRTDRWQELNLDDRTGCISIRILFCMIVLALSAAAAIVWILGTQ